MAKDESTKEDSKRPDRKMLIIAGGLVSVMLIVMGVLVVVLLKVSNPPETQESIVEVKAVPVTPTDGKATKDDKDVTKHQETVVKAEISGASKHEKKDKGDKPAYYKFSPAFIVNIPSNGRLRFLQIEVQLMAKNEDDLKNIEAYAPVIRNDLITLFSSQSYDDLLTPDGKENLRKSSLAISRKILKDNSGAPCVEQVLFTNFVTQ